jgi:glycosyltransferase involved in cell wall biosynthesis
MKVALLTQKSCNCGLDSYTSNLIPALRWLGIEVKEVPLTYFTALTAHKRIPKNVDLVHNITPCYNLKSFDKPSVMTVYDTINLDHPEWMTWKLGIYNKLLAEKAWMKYNHIIAISNNTKNDLIQHGIKTDISVVYPGVNEIFFKKWDKHILTDTFYLYVGGFDPRKNVDCLIDWFVGLKPTFPLVLMGGSGWNNKSTMDRIKKYPKLIRFYSNPTIDKLYLYYHACTKFYFPSLYEGFGLPLAEAKACGAKTWHMHNSSLDEVKPLHWRDQAKEIKKVYEEVLSNSKTYI